MVSSLSYRMVASLQSPSNTVRVTITKWCLYLVTENLLEHRAKARLQPYELNFSSWA